MKEILVKKSSERKISFKKVLVWSLLIIDVFIILLSIGGMGQGWQRYLQLKQETEKTYRMEVRLSSEVIKQREKQRLEALKSARAQIAGSTLFTLFMLIVTILAWLAVSGQLSPLLSKVVLIVNGSLVGFLALLIVLVLVFLELALRGLVSL